MNKQPPVPETDLLDYAQARGLEHRGNASQVGYLAAFPMSEELQFNVLRGELPGGEHGVLFHEARILEGTGHFGEQHATQFAGAKRARFLDVSWRDFVPMGDWLPGRTAWFKLPHTTVATRVPEAAGLLLGLQAGRDAERPVPRFANWTAVPESLRGWQGGARARADPRVVEEVVRTVIVPLLEQPRPTGFEVVYRFGTLTISQTHFAYEAEALDELCEILAWVARGIREACERHAEPLPFETELGEPFWMADVRANPGEQRIEGSDGQKLDSAIRLAQETGMTLEDGHAFMRHFGHVPFPGEIYGLLRGTLPGSDVQGRIAIAMERPAWDPHDLQKVLRHRIGGPFGCDTVMFRVDPSTPETEGIEGEQLIERGRVAVKRGVLAAWRVRERNSAQLHEVQALVHDTLEAVRGRVTIC
ncbi:MAG: hypothetical protein M3320_01655 [Actinomycetota bacterium]|nr:hypothetical protein [Actinomycetota bacterium]